MNMSKKEYNRYVARLAQKSPLGKDLLRSFLVGGLICVIGQLILNGFTALDLSEQDAAAATSVSLVFLSAVLTGLSVYDDIAKFAGAGTLVPITGFANAVVSPAIEFKAEASSPAWPRKCSSSPAPSSSTVPSPASSTA